MKPNKTELINLIKGYCSKILFISAKSSINIKRLGEIKDKYKGERIFIVCTGPSLTASDLDKIHQNGDYSFSCNKIDKMFDKTEWRPSFYAVMDNTYQYSLLETMKKVPSFYKFFRDESYITTRKAGDGTLWLKTDGSRELLDNPKFSEDASDKIYTIGTVTYAMLQLAVYMGFREIYIIGCDNSYAKNINFDGTVTESGHSSYFAGSENQDDKAVAVWEMDRGYYYARKYADERGIKIFNATRGGYLHAFERVDFDSLFRN